MKVIWYVCVVPFVYLFGTLADIYFMGQNHICKKLKIGYYKELTVAEMAEGLIMHSQRMARLKREFQEVMKLL